MKKSAPTVPATHWAIFRRRRLVEGRRYFDFSEPKYADMTPIVQLAKEFMKGREGK